jgi:hypothetical protein
MSPSHDHDHNKDHHHSHEHASGSEGPGYLARLSDLDYELEDDSPDVIGWEVADSSGGRFGKIQDLLVDMTSGQILFGVICHTGGNQERCTLVPLPGANVDTKDKLLTLPIEEQLVKAAPEFTEDTEDVQPFFEYWMDRMQEWEGPDDEEEEEFESRHIPPMS